jgi:dTDP-3,4-didehydro-2,6-dideoxy-alpha-D-glucose 3-reductase
MAMEPARIRVGVMGVAKIARRSVVPALLQCADRFELVAAASRDEAKARQFAGEFGCQPVTGYAELLARDDIDAIYMPLPTGLHAEWVGRAIAAGKHVYAEKSFASTASQTETLIAAAQARSVAVMEGYMFLYHRQQAVVADWLQQGLIGELRHFHGSFGFPPLPADDFRYDEAIGGGVLMDAAGYPLRAAFHLLGDGLSVQGASVRRCPQRGSSLWGSAFLARADGVGASIAFGFDNHYQCRYELWGSKGKLVAERAYTPGPTFAPLLTLETADGRRELAVEPDNHFVGAWLAFAQAITDPTRRAEHDCQTLVQSRALQAISDLAARWNSSR